MIVIVFGVSGVGKTTIGKRLAKDLGWRFLEADDFHSCGNIEKMRNGLPLTDEDRWPWLQRLREQITRSLAAKENAVIACSVLKRAYRERLRVGDDVEFVFLRGDYALVEKQLRRRRGHFMRPDLLQDLERPESDEDAVTIESGRTPEELVDEITKRLGLSVAN